MEPIKNNEIRKNKNAIWRETGPGFKESISDFSSHLNGFTIATGVLPASVIMFTFSVMQINLLSEAGVDEGTIVAWVATSWGIGGVIAIILSLYYKMPIAGAWSIPGMAFVGDALINGQVGINEAFGAFWMAGALILILGISGIIKFIVRLLPTPIILAMVAGILIGFPIDMIVSIQTNAWIVGSGIVGYALFNFLKGPFRRIPGVFGAIVFSVTIAALTGQLSYESFELSLGQVQFHSPTFTLESFFTISIPLAIMVFGAENMQAIGILKSRKLDPPITAMTNISGIGGMLASAFGSFSANIAGPTTAVVNTPDAGPQEGRYVAGTISGVTYIVLGIMAGTIVTIAGVLPEAVAATLLGMVLVSVVIDAIKESWGDGRYAIGAFFAFIIAIADVSFFDIGAPFWSLVGGVIISLVFEAKDFMKPYKK